MNALERLKILNAKKAGKSLPVLPANRPVPEKAKPERKHVARPQQGRGGTRQGAGRKPAKIITKVMRIPVLDAEWIIEALEYKYSNQLPPDTVPRITWRKG